MPCTLEYVQYVVGQLEEAGSIVYKKLFGEYGLWRDGFFFGTVEDNQFYIKMTKAGQRMLPEAEPAAPHGGNPGMYCVEDLEDKNFLRELVEETCRELQQPKMAAGKRKSMEKTQEKLDYKKVYKDLYMPKTKPSVIEVPEMTFIMVDGEGDPNTSEEYKSALEILYGLSFAIKMSKMSNRKPEGYFEYVVPPLEGLWKIGEEGFDGRKITDKKQFCWTSMIRQPEFVTQEVFEAAKEALHKKKPDLDLSPARLVTYTEGLCCQVMHVGSYDDEPATIEKLSNFIRESGYVPDITDQRPHHEIYLGDPRRTAPERLKTVIRHPVKKGDPAISDPS